MKVAKVSFVLICLLAYTWVFCMPAQGQEYRPQAGSSAAVHPFKVMLERNSPLYADRQMTSAIAEIPAGYNVVVLEKYDLQSSQRTVVLRVAYADGKGKEYTGWVYGTLNVHVPK